MADSERPGGDSEPERGIEETDDFEGPEAGPPESQNPPQQDPGAGPRSKTEQRKTTGTAGGKPLKGGPIIGMFCALGFALGISTVVGLWISGAFQDPEAAGGQVGTAIASSLTLSMSYLAASAAGLVAAIIGGYHLTRRGAPKRKAVRRAGTVGTIGYVAFLFCFGFTLVLGVHLVVNLVFGGRTRGEVITSIGVELSPLFKMVVNAIPAAFVAAASASFFHD